MDIASMVRRRRGESFHTIAPPSVLAGDVSDAVLEKMCADLGLNVRSVASLRAMMDRDAFPIPATEDREGYHGDRHLEYWLSGLRDYLVIRERAGDFGSELGSGSVILDFGCASGRVLRHFSAQAGSVESWGCDINVGHVEWIRRYLDPRIRVLLNTALPSLPIPDDSVDLVCAFSVFTHLDEFELSWLAELRRILKPGAMAYITIHSEHTWTRLGERSENDPLYSSMTRKMRHAWPTMDIGPGMFDSPLHEERVVFSSEPVHVYSKNVFHRTDYIRTHWARYFEVLKIYLERDRTQDVVLLQKR